VDDVIPPRPAAPQPGGRALRAARSVTAALVCVTAAAVGHRVGGGTLPAGAVVSAALGSGAIAWALSSRRITSTQLLGLLVLCQAGVHLAAAPGDTAMGPAMICAHVVATAISVAVLARGEWFVWQLSERLALRVAPLLRGAGVVVARRPLPPLVVPPRLHDVRLAHSRWLRGPPVGLV
jgi:hypothetical protein